MNRRPPALLIVAAVVYLGYLGWELAVNFTPVVAGRFALSALLFFFVLRGSRVGGNVLAILCAISALALLVAAIAAFNANALGAILFTVMAGLLLAFAAYLFFGSAVRSFQGEAAQDASP